MFLMFENVPSIPQKENTGGHVSFVKAVEFCVFKKKVLLITVYNFM